MQEKKLLIQELIWNIFFMWKLIVKGRQRDFIMKDQLGIRARITNITQKQNLHGVYVGNVEIFDSTKGKWIKKTIASSFYPKTWSRSRVISEIKSAYHNGCIIGNKFSGVSTSGVVISGYVNQKGYDINTAYPIY